MTEVESNRLVMAVSSRSCECAMPITVFTYKHWSMEIAELICCDINDVFVKFCPCVGCAFSSAISNKHATVDVFFVA